MICAAFSVQLALCILAADSPFADPLQEKLRVQQEITLEALLEALDGSKGSLVPVPVFQMDAPPVVDGSLDDPFWAEASSLLLGSVGYAWLSPGLSWRLHLAWSRGSLWIAGERSGATLELWTLALDASERERLVIVLPPAGEAPGTARVERQGDTEAVALHGGEFAASRDALRFELRLPEEFAAWPAARDRLRALRVTVAHGQPVAVEPGQWIRLVPDAMALRVQTVKLPSAIQAEFSFEVRSHQAADLAISIPPRATVVVPAGGARSILAEVDARPGRHMAVALLEAAGRPAPWRIEVPTLIWTPIDEIRRAQEALREAFALSEGQEGVGALRAEADALSRELTARNPIAKDHPPSDHLSARLLRRAAFLARYASGLDEIAFLRGFLPRAGPHYASFLHDMPGGGLSVLSLKTARVRSVALASPRPETVRDLSVDFDGRRVAYAAKDAEGHFSLWSLDLDRGAARRITNGAFDDVEPAWLPDGSLVFSSTRAGSLSPLSDADNLCLHRVQADGAGLERVSFNPLVDFTPSVLDDGRVLFVRWVHEDKPGGFLHALWTMNPDGSGLSGFFGANRPGVFVGARPIYGTGEVVCLDPGAMAQWREPLAGDLALIDLAQSRDQPVGRIAAGRGGFAGPFPVSREAFLASLGMSATRWGIYLVDRQGRREIIHRDAEYSCLHAQPLRPRVRPPVLAPGVRYHDPSSPSGEAPPATLVIQDALRGLPGVARTDAVRLRVVAVPDRPRGALPNRMTGFQDQRVPLGVAARFVRRSLGTVPILADGSAHFHVPSRTSVFFQVLDAGGRAIQTMRDTVSFGSGEHRSCVGCHEPRTEAPPAVHRGRLMALDGPPARLEPEPGPPSISFPRDLQPLLDRHCVRCHDGPERPGGVDLSADLTPFFSISYETLTRGGLNASHDLWHSVSRGQSASALAPAVANVLEPLSPRVTGSGTSPLLRLIDAGHQGVSLGLEEQALLARWIDLNLPYYDDWESARSGGERLVVSRASLETIRGAMRVECRGCHAPPDLFRGAVLNVTRPERSLLLLAPLAVDAGGLGRCAGGPLDTKETAFWKAVCTALVADRDALRNGGVR